MYDAASNNSAKVKDFVNRDGWVKPRPIYVDLIEVVTHWSIHSPNINREDEVYWVLISPLFSGSHLHTLVIINKS